MDAALSDESTSTTLQIDGQDLKTSLAKLDPSSPNFGKYDEHGRPIPPWYKQITVRAVMVAAVMGFVFNLMVLKLGFTVGIIPSLNIAAGLLGFVATKLIASVTAKLKLGGAPFTQQENTVIQTCAVACFSLAFTGGFTNYLVAMDWNTYIQVDGANSEGVPGKPVFPLPPSVVEPSYVKYMLFMLLTYYVGIFVLVPLRKIFILDYRLVYPSGTATGVVISGFHTPLGEDAAKKQVKVLGGWFATSFFFSFFKWFFGGPAETCGFNNWPSLGLQAYKWRWYFDFSQTYVAVGMICPHEVNYSVMFGAIMSYGIMWPLINSKAGDWFPAKYGQGTSNPQGLTGYKIFVSAAMILGDGLYNLIKITAITVKHFYRMYNFRELPSHAGPGSTRSGAPGGPISLGDNAKEEHTLLRDAVFLKDRLPWYVGVVGYVVLACVAMGGIPALFPAVKPYHVLIGYLLAPLFAFSNSYGCGLTDWSMITTYGKIGIFLFAWWAGRGGNGIIVGLVMCGVYCTIAGSSADLMQDFKTGYITLANPTSMFAAQLIGATLGCFITPAAFWLFWKAFTIGDPNGEYKAPFAVLFRAMALIAVEGTSYLPRHSLLMGGCAFLLAIVVNLIRDFAPPKYRPLVPIPMAAAIPVYLGGYVAISMVLGSVARYLWSRANAASEKMYSMIVASALIAGDGVWTVPAAVLAILGVHPPICMWFFPTHVFQEQFSSLPQYLPS